MREEIALAKAEMTEKVTKLVKGAAVGASPASSPSSALIYFLHSLAWGSAELLDDRHHALARLPDRRACVLFLLGALAGFLAVALHQEGLAAHARRWPSRRPS